MFGWWKRIGVITPTVIELQGYDFYNVAPEGVGMVGITCNIDDWGNPEFGDVCRVEIFSMIGGYHAGVCRTAVVGHAPPEAERIWANLAECRRMLLDMIAPGAATSPIYQAFIDRFGAIGLPPIDFVGHGIGLHLHEDPYLSVFDDSTLEAGMVLGVEPLVYRTGFGFGLQFKDMVAVTAGGSELLSDVTDNERLIVIQ